MAEQDDGRRELEPPDGFEIVLEGEYFGVVFKSPYNSIHRTSGFRSVDDAQAWIAETRLLMRTFV